MITHTIRVLLKVDGYYTRFVEHGKVVATIYTKTNKKAHALRRYLSALIG